MTEKDKTTLKIIVIYETILVIIYGLYLYTVGGGKEWVNDKLEDLKRKKKERKEHKYATLIK